MSETTSGWTHYASPALFCGLVLSGVAAAFNGRFGYAFGGDDTIRAVGFAAIAMAALGLKDYGTGRLFLAFKEQRWGVALICAILVVLGGTVSFIAAFGNASTGQAEKANPLQRQIDAYKNAKASETSILDQIAKLGTFATVTEADLTAAAAKVDKTVARRTHDCTDLTPKGSGPKAQAWNKEACRAVLKLRPDYEKGQQAAPLYADLKAARAIIAKGAPKTADALNDSLSDLWQKVSGQKDVGTASVVSLVFTLLVELGGPFAWAMFQLDMARGTVPAVPVSVPDQVPAGSTPPKPRKRKRFHNARSERQKQANALADELRNSGTVVSFKTIRDAYRAKYNAELPKVTAHRAVG